MYINMCIVYDINAPMLLLFIRIIKVIFFLFWMSQYFF